MTQAEVTKLLNSARAQGRTFITEMDVCFFLAAKEIACSPRKFDEHLVGVAQTTMQNFMTRMTTGQDFTSFDEFLIPVEMLETVEEKEEQARWAASLPEGANA